MGLQLSLDPAPVSAMLAQSHLPRRTYRVRHYAHHRFKGLPIAVGFTDPDLARDKVTSKKFPGYIHLGRRVDSDHLQLFCFVSPWSVESHGTYRRGCGRTPRHRVWS